MFNDNDLVFVKHETSLPVIGSVTSTLLDRKSKII